jgi:secreted trypsin-like serine protease
MRYRTLWGSLLVFGCSANGLEHENVATSSQAIVGGSGVTIASHPYQASLRLDGAHHCGATIVGQHWVLTAQHCLQDAADQWLAPSRLSVAAGATDLSTAAVITRTVTEIQAAPGFESPELGEDVALVRVSPPWQFIAGRLESIPVAAASDAAAGVDVPGVQATVSGYGATEPGGAPTNKLRRATELVLDNAQASAELQALGLPALSASELATEPAFCDGDDGGPLVASLSGVRKLIGVAGYNVECGGSPDVYARGSAFEPWWRNVRNSTRVEEWSFEVSHASGGGTTFFAFPGIPLPSVAFGLSVSSVGSSGNGDLLINHDDIPHSTGNRCQPVLDGVTEYCHFPTPEAGPWIVELQVWTPITAATVSASYRIPNHVVLEDVGGELAADGWAFHGPYPVEVGKNFYAHLNGVGSDPELYVRFGAQPDLTNFDCHASEANLGGETCDLPATSNVAWVGVKQRFPRVPTEYSARIIYDPE